MSETENKAQATCAKCGMSGLGGKHASMCPANDWLEDDDSGPLVRDPESWQAVAAEGRKWQ
jgi:hypothetical protein